MPKVIHKPLVQKSAQTHLDPVLELGNEEAVKTGGTSQKTSGWQGMVTKMVAGATLFSALVIPMGASANNNAHPDQLNGRTAQMRLMTADKPNALLPAGTTFKLVAPGPQHVVSADDALGYIVAAYRAADGSKVAWDDVRALNPTIFSRDATGSALRPGDVVTLPFGAVKVADAKKLVTRGEIADLQTPAPIVVAPVVPPNKPVVVNETPAVTTPVVVAPVVVAPVVVAPVANPVVTQVGNAVVDTVVKPVAPAIPESAAFKFPALEAGKNIAVDGVFKTKKLFKTWTINFTGSAKVVKSDHGALSVQVTATGTNGIFDGKTRTVALEWKQTGSTPEVRFTGKQVGDTDDGGDAAARLTLVRSSGSESVFRASDGSEVKFNLANGVLTMHYDQNVIHLRVGG